MGDKAGDVLLKRYRDRVTDHRAAGAVKECIWDILPMKGRRYAELICVCLVAEGFVKIKSIATWLISLGRLRTESSHSRECRL